MKSIIITILMMFTLSVYAQVENQVLIGRWTFKKHALPPNFIDKKTINMATELRITQDTIYSIYDGKKSNISYFVKRSSCEVKKDTLFIYISGYNKKYYYLYTKLK